MQLMKTFKHGSTNDHIFKVAFIEGTQLVSGGQDGSAHLYDCRSGLPVEKLAHSHCRFFRYSFISASTQVFTFKAGEFLQTVTVGSMCLSESRFWFYDAQTRTVAGKNIIATATSVIKVWAEKERDDSPTAVTTPQTRRFSIVEILLCMIFAIISNMVIVLNLNKLVFLSEPAFWFKIYNSYFTVRSI